MTFYSYLKSLDKLCEYCKKWQLSVNVKKTKAIIFQQRNIPYNKSDFYLNGNKLEKVLKYKYLRKFHSTHIELSKKGSKVMFSMFKYLNPIENVSIKIYKNYLNFLLNLYSCITQKFGTWISMENYLKDNCGQTSQILI